MRELATLLTELEGSAIADPGPRPAGEMPEKAGSGHAVCGGAGLTTTVVNPSLLDTVC